MKSLPEILRWFVLMVCLMPAACSQAEWASYLGGNDRAGYTPSRLDLPLELVWTYQTPAKPEKAWEGPRSEPIEGHEMRHRVDFDDAMQVVMSQGRAYFGSTVDHKLYCVDAQTGQTVWSFYTDGPIRLAPTLAHGNVYVGSDDGLVYCLRADDGSLVWKMRVGPRDDRLLSRGEMISRWPVRTGVLVDGEIAYFGAGVFPHEMVYLCAVNAKDGTVIWRRDTISEEDAGRNDLSPQGYLLANSTTLYVPSGRSLPVAVSKQNGEILFQRQYSWRTDAGGVVGGTKAVLGDGQIFAGGPHHFLAMDQTTGRVGEAYITGRQMVLADDVAYLLTGENLLCVDRDVHAKASQEKQKWFLRARDVRGDQAKLAEAKQMMKEFSEKGILWQHPSEFDDVLVATANLVVAGGQDRLIALDRQNGKELWSVTVEGNVRGIAIDDGMMIVSTDEGRLYAFRHVGQPVEQVQHWPPPYPAQPFPNDSLSEFYEAAAADILKLSGQRTGFCLVLGSERGRLAYELARQSSLNVIGVEPDAEKAEESRRALEAVGIHGVRVTILNLPLEQMPLSNYFANLIVSDSLMLEGKMPCEPESVARHLKPCGGMVVLGAPRSVAGPLTPIDQPSLSGWLTTLFHQDEGELVAESPWYQLRRGQLPGAGAWSHQYGNVANTSFSNDQRIRDGLGVLWYGDPGPSSMINRHEAAGAPLSTNGRMFIQGTDSIMAYDAYNGTFLWEHRNPGAIRTGVFNNRETHNLAASDDHLFAAVDNTCTVLNAADGKVVAEYTTPDSPDGIARAWAYLAYDDGQLFGTSTIREELEARLRRRGLTVKSQTDAIFAVDAKTGERVWVYRGSNILHTTIAIGPERVYFIDSSISPAERQELYLRDKGDLKNLTGEAARQAEEAMKKLDLRLAVALDRRTGEKVWERPVDVTDTTEVSAGGGSLTLMYADGHVVLCGANANGHYWKQFLAGEFEKRKLIVLDANSGETLWSKNANYMNRPAVIGSEIFAEPWAFDLHSGEPKKRPHPLTGEDSEWRFSRPGHHCGVITATPNMMFFRSGFIGYYDLYNDSGTRHFSGQRLGCWINAIPGNGLVMIPEASAGCVCQFSIASTVVMEPKSENKSWGIFSAVGPTTPVKRIGVNFGAPGDRKDASGKEWFGYPRPHSVGRLEFVFDLKQQLAPGGGWYRRNAESTNVADSETPWLLTSGARGLNRFQIPLLAESDPPASYQVKLYFAALESDPCGPLSVKLQGETVAQSVDVEAEVGTHHARILSFSGVQVERELDVELVSQDPEKLATLAAIEVIREGDDANEDQPIGQ